MRLLQVILFALVIVLGLNALGLLDPQPLTVDVTRITGEDPVSASASVARQSHPGDAPIVVIAGTEALADGVVATGLAGALDAPILLNGTDALDPQILDVMRELDVAEAVLIGGVNALSGDFEATLEEDLEIEVTRLAGASRFDTAGLVADLFAQETDPAEINGLPSALIVPAENVSAGLEAGSLAASRATPLPILISQEGRLPAPTLSAIDRLGIEQLFVVPADASGQGQIGQDFDGPIQIVQGRNGAAQIAIDVRDFRPPRVVVVPPDDQARTLVAGPLAGRESGVILTADSATQWLATNCGTVDDIFVIAEPSIIGDELIAEAEAAATQCPEE